MAGEEDKVTKIEDANLVAYLTMKGIIAIPYIAMEESQGRGSQVAWDVQGNIDDEIKEFYSNRSIYDFVKALKVVRSEMYTMKQISGQLKKS